MHFANLSIFCSPCLARICVVPFVAPAPTRCTLRFRCRTPPARLSNAPFCPRARTPRSPCSFKPPLDSLCSPNERPPPARPHINLHTHTHSRTSWLPSSARLCLGCSPTASPPGRSSAREAVAPPRRVWACWAGPCTRPRTTPTTTARAACINTGQRRRCTRLCLAWQRSCGCGYGAACCDRGRCRCRGRGRSPQAAAPLLQRCRLPARKGMSLRVALHAFYRCSWRAVGLEFRKEHCITHTTIACLSMAIQRDPKSFVCTGDSQSSAGERGVEVKLIPIPILRDGGGGVMRMSG